MCDPRYICPEGIRCFIFCTASDKNILVIFFTASAPHHPVNNLFPERQCFMQSENRRIENIPKISMCVLPTGKAALPPRSFASPTSWPGIRATASNPKPAFQPLVHQCSASNSNHIPSHAYYYESYAYSIHLSSPLHNQKKRSKQIFEVDHPPP